MRSFAMSQQWTIAGQIFLAIRDTPGFPLDELVLSLPRFTWNQVFLEVNRLRRTGQVQVTALGVGNYTVRLQNEGTRRDRDRHLQGLRGTTKAVACRG